MKPYGREKHVTGGNQWKRDYHMHKNGRKLENWWESICAYVPRSTTKISCNKNIENEILENIGRQVNEKH